MAKHKSFIPYPPIEKHGVIGDRRTAALVAADGTLSWLCVPNYDSTVIFGALLDAELGGFWRFGPSVLLAGQQNYLDSSATLVTKWATNVWELELTDSMAWPQDNRPPETEGMRVVIRRLRCLRGETTCTMQIHPRYNFDEGAIVRVVNGGLTFNAKGHLLGLWTSFPIIVNDNKGEVSTILNLNEGDEVWSVLALNSAIMRSSNISLTLLPTLSTVPWLISSRVVSGKMNIGK